MSRHDNQMRFEQAGKTLCTTRSRCARILAALATTGLGAVLLVAPVAAADAAPVSTQQVILRGEVGTNPSAAELETQPSTASSQQTRNAQLPQPSGVIENGKSLGGAQESANNPGVEGGQVPVHAGETAPLHELKGDVSAPLEQPQPAAELPLLAAQTPGNDSLVPAAIRGGIGAHGKGQVCARARSGGADSCNDEGISDTNLNCTDRYFYSLSKTGDLYSINRRETNARGVPTAVRISAPDNAPLLPKGLGAGEWNALAISQTGQNVYALQRYAAPNSVAGAQNAGVIYRFNLKTRKWIETGMQFQTEFPDLDLVAGAISYTSGEYFIGGYTHADSHTQFQLYAYAPNRQSLRYVGYIPIETSTSESLHTGDIAFNNAGDLILVRGNGDNIQLYTVAETQLSSYQARPYNQQLQATKSLQFPLADSATVDGLAFDSQGALVVSNSHSWANVDIYNMALQDGRSYPSFATAQYANTDLAACAAPPTVTVEKAVASRYRETDQFALSVTGEQATVGAPYTTTVTSGSKPGMQTERLTAFPVMTGKTYLIKEEYVNGAKAENYRPDLECRNQFGKEVFVQAVAAGSFAIPVNSECAAQRIICTFTNEALGKLRVQKIDKDEPSKLLPGAVFELTRKGVAGNASNPLELKTGADGIAVKEGLPFGEYTLVEKAVPTGYLLDPTPINVSINSQSAGADGFITVVVKNQRQLGTVKFAKVNDAPTPLPLGGSSWVLTGPANGLVPSATREVTDCVAVGKCKAGGDQDPRPGYFELTGLELGGYVLQEKEAPLAYAKDDTKHPFTLTPAAPDVDLTQTPFVNKRLDLPPLPRTGSAKLPLILAAGATLLFAAAATAAATSRR